MTEEEISRTIEAIGKTLPAAPDVPEKLPVLPLSDLVVFPNMVAPLLVNNKPSTQLIDDVVAGDRLVVLTLQKNPEQEYPHRHELHDLGCLARVLRMLKFPDDSVRVLIQGIRRVQLGEAISESPYLVARVSAVEDEVDRGIELSALARNAANQFQEIINLTPGMPDELKVAILNIEDLAKLSDVIATNLNIPLHEKQGVLECINLRERYDVLTLLLNRELEVLQLGSEIQHKVSSALSKSQREYFLREQLKTIQKELGDVGEVNSEINELRDKVDKAAMPVEAKKVAIREVERLAIIPSASAEYTVSRTYLDWLITLPWAKTTDDKLDVARARRILNEDHYDLDPVKKRILEYLSVLKLKANHNGVGASVPAKSPILCFVGPPGVGKTSLGMSIARALDRKFIRLSLGGVRDEAEIRGHRRTYIGALPGRILQGIRRAESNNPVFMLDEIDKVGTDFRGDPSAALLEVLDPQQNNTFADHYLEVAFDLSRVMFITTANQLDPIPPALRDRMEIIELPGYTDLEKIHIATRYLVPRQLGENGLKQSQLQFTADALTRVIGDYTHEAGVRNLERRIATVCRRTARKLVEGRVTSVQVTGKNLRKFLGAPEFLHDVVERTTDPGVAVGLAWTSAGGDILFIEATRMPGKGNLILTGSLGDVMKESVQAALSYIRSHAREFGIEDKIFEQFDLHVHVPAGAIPKDGPSAGVTMAVALASLLTKRHVKPALALTGEITLRGKVLPVGGIKEKVLAAARSGIKTVVLPEHNRKDITDVPAEIRKKLKFRFVKTIADALKAAL